MDAPSTNMKDKLFSEKVTEAILAPITPVDERMISLTKNSLRKLQT